MSDFDVTRDYNRVSDELSSMFPRLSKIGLFGRVAKGLVLDKETRIENAEISRKELGKFAWRGDNWSANHSFINYTIEDVGENSGLAMTRSCALTMNEARQIISGERERPKWFDDEFLEATEKFLNQEGIEKFINDEPFADAQGYEKRAGVAATPPAP